MTTSPASYKEALDVSNEYGVVEKVNHPLVFIRGLPGATADEIILFEDNQRGYVLTLSRDYVEVIMLADERVGLGSKVSRTDTHLAVSIGEDLRGTIINPLGVPLLEGSLGSTHSSEDRLLDTRPPNIDMRSKIDENLLTGSTVVDLMMPLGLGQRQAILGDQKTGKTSWLLSTLQTFTERGIVIYAAIGKPLDAIAKAHTFIQQTARMDNVIMVAARADDVPSLVLLAPFTAMTIAEYFRDLGHDVLVILDDMTTHAQFYREISLLGRRFPGRESYPGDIFHLHARILERAGRFKHQRVGDVSITCLPVAETVRSDLSGYIVSNLIGITDGHLLFDAVLFNQGQRPAIDTRLSVTRVGLQTLKGLDKELQRTLGQMMKKHERVAEYAHFGAELSPEVAGLIDAGGKLKYLMTQPPYFTVPRAVQLVMATMVWQGWMADQAEDAVGQCRDRLVLHYTGSAAARALLDELVEVDDLPKFVAILAEKKDSILELCQSETIT